MDTEAKNMKAPEEIEALDFSCDNMENFGMGEDYDAINADADDDDVLDEDEMENPISKSDSCDDDDDDDMDKSEGDEDDKDDDDKEDDDDDDALRKQAKKSGYAVADLNKSIARLVNHVQASDPHARKKALLQRASLGKSLSKSEHAELMRHLSKSAPHKGSQRLAKGLNENRVIQESIDVAPYLAQQTQELVKALGHVDNRISANASANTELNLLMAKAIASIGQEVRRLGKSLAAVDAAPVSGPKSMGITGRSRPLQKSGMQTQVTQKQASDALDGLLQKSGEMGSYGRSQSGADLLKASTHFESCGQLTPEVEADIRRYIRENR